MIDLKAPNDTIPFVAYGMISLTSLILAYATLMDNEPANVSTEMPGEKSSATSFLPDIFNKSASSTNLPNAVPIEQPPGVPVIPLAPIIPTAPLDNSSLPAQPEENSPFKIGGKKKKTRKRLISIR